VDGALFGTLRSWKVRSVVRRVISRPLRSAISNLFIQEIVDRTRNQVRTMESNVPIEIVIQDLNG
jgi:hypothetical protein